LPAVGGGRAARALPAAPRPAPPDPGGRRDRRLRPPAEDPRRPDAVPRPPVPRDLGGARALRPGPLPAGGGRGPPPLRVHPVRQRPARLRRQQLRAHGDDDRPGDERRPLPGDGRRRGAGSRGLRGGDPAGPPDPPAAARADAAGVSTRDAVGPWLKIAPGAPEARVRLAVVPYARGAPAAFRNWPAALAPPGRLVHVVLPGRDVRFPETPVLRSEEIVGPVAEALAPLDDRPLVLFGHSMGSMLAFEVARRLRRSGRRGPDALVVSGRGAPQIGSR